MNCIMGYRGKGWNNCLSPAQGTCDESQLGLWKSTNSIGNINTVAVAENNLLADEKGPWKG